MKITDYGMASGRTSSDLIESVKKWISFGFQPHGSLAIDQSSALNWFYQPMVKYEENGK